MRSEIFENEFIKNIDPKTLGLVEKSLRLSRNLTIEQTANCLNISRGNLCEIENGKRNLKPDVFVKFVHRFFKDFNFGYALVEKAEKKLDELFNAFAYRDYEAEGEVEKWIEQNRAHLRNSLACLYLTVFEVYFYYRKPMDKEDVEKLKNAKDFIPYFSPDVRAFLLFCEGYMYQKGGDGQRTIELYGDALHQMDGWKWPQLEGIIKQNLACLAYQEVSFYEPYELICRAEELYLQEANFLRVFNAWNNKAVYLAMTGNFKKSIVLLDKVLLNRRTFRDNLICRQAVSNKIFVLTLSEQFMDALEFIKQEKSELNPRHPGNFILEPYCLFRLGENQKCLEAIKEYENYQLCEEDEVLYALLKAMINQNSSRIEKMKNRMYLICSREKNWGMLAVLSLLMIDHYTKTGQTQLLVDAYEQKTRIFNHQLPVIHKN